MNNCAKAEAEVTNEDKNQIEKKKSETLASKSISVLGWTITIVDIGDGFANGTINLGELQVAQISTFNKVWASYEEHSVSIWVDHFDLEFKEDVDKPVVYSSLHGHAIYPKQGTNLQGANGVGIRNDTAATNMVVDMTIGTVEEGRERVAWEVEEASREYGEQFAEEVLGQEGPTGPKVKNYWNGDEVVR
ncbi:hypothetical protein K1719_023012 [Acacia pycnantha]|nr:hypothetical protein K1719_023012 [Acacia pycnantha]